jgi:hypothetical protein
LSSPRASRYRLFRESAPEVRRPGSVGASCPAVPRRRLPWVAWRKLPGCSRSSNP